MQEFVHFGVQAVSGAKEIDKANEKSLYCNDLSSKDLWPGGTLLRRYLPSSYGDKYVL
jgi:hypothetical protein